MGRNQSICYKNHEVNTLADKLDKPRPNCAVIGIYGLEEASTLAYLGLYALQHRGQEASGIVSSDGSSMFRHAGMGLVSDVFKLRSTFDRLKGKAAIGHNRYSTTGPSSDDNVQPLLVEDRTGPVAMSHNGNLVNYRNLRMFLEEEGSIFRTSSDSELVLHLLARSHGSNLYERLTSAIRMVHGAYSMTLLTRDCLIAMRDPYGFRPLCIGRKDKGWIVASESCAFDLVGAEYIRDVKPGEMLLIKNNGMKSFMFSRAKSRAHCIFEYVYFSRPDSLIFGDNVDKTRRRLGHILAIGHKVKGAKIVISVPDSSNTAALGYAVEAGIPFEIALIRNHYIGRTFIEPEQRMRDFGVKIKFNVVAGVLKDKKIVLVDDSIVRGTTLKKLVRLIRGAGAKEVHVRISSPPIKHPCYYGMDFPTREELAAFAHSVDEIKEYIEADSLEYLTAEELLDAVPHDNGQGYCTACFTGKYPVAIDEDVSPIKLEK